ncbi:MAG: aminoacyl-tRNA hydrolase [Bacteroidetes bacterium]|nr:aminoacyl-tRNA hydrolase [Bacteroidota bacterium]
MAFDVNRLLKEVWFKATTSGGKGGQNVNKVATRVELYFDVVNSNVFSADEQALLMQKLESKLTEEGILRMVSSEERTQLKNKDKVQEKFLKLIEKTLLIKKPRKKTKP